MTERDALLILNAINSLGNGCIRKLIAHFGSAQDVLNVNPQQLLKDNLITPKMAKGMADFSHQEFIQKENSLIEKYCARVVAYDDADYPELLKQIPDAPILFYAKGDVQRIQSLSVSMVGSRKASTYGLRMAEQFAADLARFGITVISGMARGIDTLAHQGALGVKGVTVAVLGSGLTNIYPKENAKLFHNIVQTGVVISEFPMQMAPIAYNFPRRNRIISGLALGVLVVEAFERSGALITSRMALEQGREVFALPGNINAVQAKGTNALIKQGAKLVTCVEDILEELNTPMKQCLAQEKTINNREKSKKTVEFLPDLSSEESKIYDVLGFDPTHIDELAHQCAMSVMELSSVVLGLELKRLIKPLPGKLYVKSR